ncbi:hypothetical protein E2C01_051522 [Portunus trituberculatus]|uniref:Uncharacterized protein n=1 Tax=Portunus trituberculatus TaxID=210409 RepID=A0A5B7GJ49_PORTR|nr:hypothetical protein [Portunus trituberculatus]
MTLGWRQVTSCWHSHGTLLHIGLQEKSRQRILLSYLQELFGQTNNSSWMERSFASESGIPAGKWWRRHQF